MTHALYLLRLGYTKELLRLNSKKMHKNQRALVCYMPTVIYFGLSGYLLNVLAISWVSSSKIIGIRICTINVEL